MNGSYCLFGRFFITFFSTYMRREVTVVLDFIKDDKEKIGDNLRKIRERKKLTQEKLAQIEYYGAAEPPVRCGESHLSGLTEPPHFVY